LRRSRGIDGAACYYVPDHIWSQTCHTLATGVPPRHERIVLWAGAYGHNDAYVTTALVPHQVTSSRSCRIPPSAMKTISEVVRHHDLLVLAQVHSHPNEAFHSDGDSWNAVGSLPGFLSIVVPYYAADCSLSDAEVYRYLEAGEWEHVTGSRKSAVLRLQPTMLDMRCSNHELHE